MDYKYLVLCDISRDIPYGIDEHTDLVGVYDTRYDADVCANKLQEETECNDDEFVFFRVVQIPSNGPCNHIGISSAFYIE